MSPVLNYFVYSLFVVFAMSRPDEAEILRVDDEPADGQGDGAAGEPSAVTPTGPPLGFLSSVMPPAAGPPPVAKSPAAPSTKATTAAKATGGYGY